MEDVHWAAFVIPPLMIFVGVAMFANARKVAAINSEALKALGTKSATKALPRSTPGQFRVAGTVLALGGISVLIFGWLPRLF
ncbi:hypothetical protein [Yonghaparkia sp. Soil809]|uniref:hypothetical protein n=1 Tax=Yonghaparkia sp. Soil809 TaxID=1736417 RepID=UPI0012EA397A|nr:hypothetical protein [Yonghaparkia sp. Soil809]